MTLAATVSRSVALGRLGLDLARVRRQAAGPGAAAARQLVSRRMGRMHGLPQKIGQILSLADLEGQGGEYDGLTDGGDAAPSSDSFAWIASELGAPVTEVFSEIEPRAFAASIGQVHRAILRDGRAVAVKVQYPDIAAAVDTDLAALGVLASPMTARHTAFDLAAYRREMRQNLVTELDYHREATTLRRFAAWRDAVPGLRTPDVIDRWSTARVLTMTWLDGDDLASARQWPAADRREALLVLLRTFLRGCFDWRELHADPHAGNLRFRRGDGGVEVALLDFGSTKQLTPGESWGLRQLAQHGATLSDDDLASAWSALGFGPEVTQTLRHRLPEVTAILFEPFLTNAPFDVLDWHVSGRLAAALGEDRWTFRVAGPATLLFLIRAFQGLLVHARALGMPVNWRHELSAVLDMTHETPAAPDVVASPADEAPLESTMLRLEVTRAGRPVARLGFKAAAMTCLSDLVPADLQATLRARGIDTATIAAASLARRCPPGELFTLDDADARVRVWLE